MVINCYGRQYQINLAVLLAVVLMVALMLKLGFWQINRAAEKKDWLESLANAETLPTQALYKQPADFEAWQYKKAELYGRYLNEQQFLLDNQFSGLQEDKRAGFNVITPFELEDKTIVLVNRGWLPREHNKSVLPVVGINAELKSVKGVLSKPAKQFSLGDITSQKHTWPVLVQYVDTREMSAILQREIAPMMLMLSPSEAEGYARNWDKKKTIKMGPSAHYGYAFQWFALSFTLVSLSVLIVLKKSIKRT